MKENFDIETLERKNIYKTPENFFKEIQNNVLRETVHKNWDITPLKAEKQSAKKHFTWIYAVAAALALLFGLGFLFNEKHQKSVENNLAKMETKKETIEISKSPVSTPILADHPLVTVANEQKESKISNKKTDLTSARTFHQKENKTLAITEKPIAKTVVKHSETKEKTALSEEEIAEQMISSLNSDEVADLAMNTEQDVYLDLYN